MSSNSPEINIDNYTPFPEETQPSSRGYHLLLPFLVVLSAMLYTILTNFFVDSDSFWSIAIGQWISTHHTIPHVDVFSWILANKPWHPMEWLFCWGIYKTDLLWGFPGIALAAVIVYLVTGYIIYATCNALNRSNLTKWVFAFGMSALIVITATPRAYIFTFAFIAVLMYFLRIKPNSRWIYLLPLMFIFWGNMQNTAIFGVGILVAEAAVGSIFYKDHKLWLVTILSLLATLINPFGINMWLDTIKIMLSPAKGMIFEWMPPNFNNIYALMLYTAIAMLGTFSLFSKPWSSLSRNERMLVLWFWLSFFYSLTAVRAIHYSLLFIILLVSAVPPTILQKRFNLKPVYLIIIACTMTAFMLYCFKLTPRENLFTGNLMSLPCGATEFLKQHAALQKGLFNDYMYGGYLMMNDIEVFIDARADLYIHNGIFQEYSLASDLAISPQQLFDVYGIRTVLTGRDTNFCRYLDQRPGWKPIYVDKTSVIFIRD